MEALNWSQWMSLAGASKDAPRSPGVYVASIAGQPATPDNAAAAQLDDELLRTYPDLLNRRPAGARNIVVVASANSDEIDGEW